MARPYIYGSHKRHANWAGPLNRIMKMWLGRSPDVPDYHDFAIFIGHPYDGGGLIVNLDKPEVQEIIRTLDGPHTKTLLKVMELRNKDKNG